LDSPTVHRLRSTIFQYGSWLNGFSSNPFSGR
jgi:hypothetical protein